MLPGWHISESGLVGPKYARIRLSQHHESQSAGHVDVEFVLDETSPTRVQLWDCVSGFGAAPSDLALSAAHIWCQTTAAAILELKYSRRGEFASHYHGDDPNGLRGWHVIAGAILGYGQGDSADQLQQWWLEYPVLPALSPALHDALAEGACPRGFKLLFGGDDVAEVRLDGERHEVASAALANLPWPRLKLPGFVRSYVVVLHDEGRVAAHVGRATPKARAGE